MPSTTREHSTVAGVVTKNGNLPLPRGARAVPLVGAPSGGAATMAALARRALWNGARRSPTSDRGGGWRTQPQARRPTGHPLRVDGGEVEGGGTGSLEEWVPVGLCRTLARRAGAYWLVHPRPRRRGDQVGVVDPERGGGGERELWICWYATVQL
jgi:hypothetical protein